MLLAVKLTLITVLFWILIQDLKERKVYWVLFPIVGFCCALLHYQKTLPELFIMSAVMNLIFVLILLAIVFIYAKLKLKTNFSSVFGPGDALFFLCLAVSFSTVSFIVIFIGALMFSLVLHLVLSRNRPNLSVPLAGYMSLFFGFAFIAYWFGVINSVYSI